MPAPKNIPDWLKGNIPLQRRYFAALRSSAAGCSSNCHKAAVARKFQKLAIQEEVKKIVAKDRKR